MKKNLIDVSLVASLVVLLLAAATPQYLPLSGGVGWVKSLNKVYYARAYATGGNGTSASPWTSASGTGGCQEAVNVVAAAGGGRVVLEDGDYLVTATGGCVPADNVHLEFSRNAKMLAGADNVTLLKVSTHAFSGQIWNASLDGNGHTGVTGMDLTNLRYGAMLMNPLMANMQNGIILRSSFDIPVINPAISGTAYPITLTASSGGVKILNPNIDGEISTACTDGITINSTGGAVVGTIIDGGYVQGCSDVGILDSAIGTKVKDTYFEANTAADIYENTATDPVIKATQHFASLGAVAIKGRNTTGAYIQAPLMGNTARSTGLYDWDGTNTNCYEFHIVDAGSKNLPLGTVTGLRTFPTVAESGDFGSFTANTITGEAGTALGLKGGTGAIYDLDVTDPTGLNNRFLIAEPGNASYIDGTIFQTKMGISISQSVRSDSGLKHQRFGATCATAATAGATCTNGSDYAWSTAFADTNYTVTCWGSTPTGTPALALASKTASGFNVQVTAISATASSFAGIECEAMHD